MGPKPVPGRMIRGNESVQVVVRCRPMSEVEIKNQHTCVISVDTLRGSIEITNPKQNATEAKKQFTFDAVYDWNSTQEDIYQTVRPLVASVLSGFNGTILAYGQTGTGKTHTMEGCLSNPNNKGIILRSFEQIFSHIGRSANQQFLVRTSYLEIYLEEIRDLLVADSKDKCEIHEAADRGVYVKHLTSIVCKDAVALLNVVTGGNQSRTTGCTNMNDHSSRSHAILTVTIEMVDLELSEGDHKCVRMGRLNLVDLAGSERQGKSGASGEQLKEASKINLSLSALGNVISALVDGRTTHVPYRDSKLTRLLQDSLGGNSKTIMVANIGPASYNYEESLTTLRYANRAKNIKNQPKVNEDPKDALLRQYREEIALLKSQLAEKQLAEKQMAEQQMRQVSHQDKRQDNREVEELAQEMAQLQVQAKPQAKVQPEPILTHAQADQVLPTAQAELPHIQAPSTHAQVKVRAEQALAHVLPDQALSHELPDQAFAHALPDQALAHELPDQALPHPLPDQALPHALPDQALPLPDKALPHALPDQALPHPVPDQAPSTARLHTRPIIQRDHAPLTEQEKSKLEAHRHARIKSSLQLDQASLHAQANLKLEAILFEKEQAKQLAKERRRARAKAEAEAVLREQAKVVAEQAKVEAEQVPHELAKDQLESLSVRVKVQPEPTHAQGKVPAEEVFLVAQDKTEPVQALPQLVPISSSVNRGLPGSISLLSSDPHVRSFPAKVCKTKAPDKAAEEKKLRENRKLREELERKIANMESLVLRGGKNIIDHTNAQQRELELQQQQIAEKKRMEVLMRQQLEKQEDAATEIQTSYSNLHQEVEVKTRKLKKVFNKFQSIKQDIHDITEEFNRDRRDVEATQNDLLKELKAKYMIIENFIPIEEKNKLVQRLVYDDELDDWVVKKTVGTAPMLKRMFANSDRRPVSEYNFMAAAATRPPANYRYKSENMLTLSPIPLPKSAQAYRMPTVAPKIKAVLDKALMVEEDLNIDASKHAMKQSAKGSKVRRRNTSKPAKPPVVMGPPPVYPKARGLVPRK